MGANAVVFSGAAWSSAFLVIRIGGWQPKIGDPSAMGWLTVFSYYACAGLSLAYFLSARSRLDRPLRRFAITMTGLLVLLGLIKNFNLLSAVTEMGRLLAGRADWLESRRFPQLVLMIVVVLGAVVVFVRTTRHQSFAILRKKRAPELIGLTYLCVFVLWRAISLHQFGAWLSREVFGLRLNWIGELAGIYALMVVLIVRMLDRERRGAPS